jgi:precorrin-2 dehydrogenase/sirohydrochlorin ferrochelatase
MTNNIVMGKYPVFLELTGRRTVVVGGGAVAARKSQGLLAAGARLVVVADRISDMMMAFCADSNTELIKSRYSKDYLVGAVLVIAATNDRRLNRRIYKDCQELEILCNVVDSPKHCDFFVPAVVKRGDLQIAIGTEGQSPAYAGHIRKKLEGIFTEKHGEFLTEIEAMREKLIREVADPAERKAISGELVDDASFEYFIKNGPEQWRKKADEIIHRRDR